MGAPGESSPPREVTARELQKLARRIERDAALRRKLLVKVGELEASIREAKRLFRQLVEQLGVEQLAGDSASRGEDVP
jgi:hypothetical protein